MESKVKGRQGPMEMKVDVRWRLNKDHVLLEDTSKNVVPYFYRLDGNKLTLALTGSLKNEIAGNDFGSKRGMGDFSEARTALPLGIPRPSIRSIGGARVSVGRETWMQGLISPPVFCGNRLRPLSKPLNLSRT